MALEIQSVTDGNAHVRLVVGGTLDTATSPQLEAALTSVLEGKPSLLVFDLAGLTFLTSAGIRVLSLARKAVAAGGGVVAMVNMQPQIVKVFEIVRALPGFTVFESQEELDVYLVNMQRKHHARP